LKKPTKANAEVLSSLFPTTSAQKRSSKSTFDPTDECVAALSQKKKAIQCKSTKVTVLLVDPAKGIPKSKYRRELKENGCEEVIEIKRNMTFDQVNSEILKSFGTTDYKILHPKDGKLILGSNQTPTGDELVEIMTK